MRAALVLFVVGLLGLKAQAIETDQFITWTVELKDSSEVINEYINGKISEVVEKANQEEKPLSCRKISRKVFNNLVGQFKISEISTWAATTPLIERYPDVEVPMSDYQDVSIYMTAQFPFNMVGLSRNINVGGVYLGTDKLGHFILLGRNYFNRYHRKLEKYEGDVAKAIKSTIRRGVRDEYIYLGYFLGGVFSYADLEANYQGLLFGLDLCHRGEGYLLFEDGKWRMNDTFTFDINNYFSPRMDESYNLSKWRTRIWKKTVEPTIQDLYCPLVNSPLVQSRWKYYKELERKREKAESQDDFLQEFSSEMFEGKLLDRSQTVQAACDGIQ